MNWRLFRRRKSISVPVPSFATDIGRPRRSPLRLVWIVGLAAGAAVWFAAVPKPETRASAPMIADASDIRTDAEAAALKDMGSPDSLPVSPSSARIARNHDAGGCYIEHIAATAKHRTYDRRSPGCRSDEQGVPESSVSANACSTCMRDSRGRIERSSTAKYDFEKTHPCPSTRKTNEACPGYVIDHVKPLACGGADTPGNMQWQSESAAKAKDKVERIGCR